MKVRKKQMPYQYNITDILYIKRKPEKAYLYVAIRA